MFIDDINTVARYK